MASIIDTFIEQAKKNPKRVAFPECDNEIMMTAAFQVQESGIGTSVMVGDGAKLKELCVERGFDPSKVEIVDVNDEAYTADLVKRYVDDPNTMLKEKGVRRRIADPMYYAMAMEAVGDVDITFAGINCPTGDVIQAGITMVGLAEGIATPSSIGLFEIPGYEGSQGNLLVFGDSAVCVNPDAEQLADIAISACTTVADLLKWDPKCALLSFSTTGSAQHELLEKVIAAKGIANEKRPDLKIDGEFQLDAAINPKVGKKKVKHESEVAGQANIIIWPDLNAGNIGVKLVQFFAGADAYGPILQGFRKVVCDCSRSAPVSEIVGNVAMSVIRAGAND